MNIIVQPRTRCAYLLTDTARYDRDGVIGQFLPKVLTLRLPGRISAAIATTGMGSQWHYRRHFERRALGSATQLLSSLGAIFKKVEQDLIDQGVPAACGSPHMSAVIAVYDHDNDEVGGYAISNDCTIFPRGSYEPYRVQPVLKYLTRYRGSPFPQGTDFSNPLQWDAGRSARTLVEAQRADDFGSGGPSYAAVGGRAILTSVGREGVSHRVVAAWPDRVGQKIDRSLDASLSLSDTFRQGARRALLPRMPQVRLRRPTLTAVH